MSRGYTEADFHAMEACFLSYPSGIRLARYKGSEFPGTLEGTHPPITIKCLHPSYLRKKHERRADKILEKYDIQEADRVLVFGCGFGWLCEALEEKTFAQVLGVDISDYVQEVMHQSPDIWLRKGISAAGLFPGTGHGKKIYDDFKDEEPITTAEILNVDLKYKHGAAKVLDYFNGNPPDYVITEEVWQILSAAEIEAYSSVFDAWGSVIIHYIEARVF